MICFAYVVYVDAKSKQKFWGLCINFSLHPWVNSKNRVDVQGVERYTYIEK